MKIISLFNHKGGVSKTTTTFHLGWILAEMGKRVLMVDTDPQCNLTGVCLSLSGNYDFDKFYRNKNISNLKEALLPVFEGQPIPLEPAKCYEFPLRKNLYLLPGHIGFSEFDVSIGIAQELSGSLKMAQNIPGAISHLLRITSHYYDFDYILIDMSPSVSSTNANLLMQSDYFIVPCAPDYYCNMAINSLTNKIKVWKDTYETLKVYPVFKEATYKLPNTTPKFIGTILQRYRQRNGSATRSFKQWIEIINRNVADTLVPMLRNSDMIINEEKFKNITSEEEPYNIVNISDFNGLIAQSQKYSKPIFALEDNELEQQGNVLTTMINSKETFHKTFTEFGKIVIKLTT